MSAAYSEGDAALLPCKASCSSWSGLKPGRSVAPSQEVASVYTRGEAWLERKRQRETELREERSRQEICACTFCPDTRALSGVRAGAETLQKKSTSITKDEAQRFFQRNLAWKQRLDERHDNQRKKGLEAAEVEVRALRRTASTPVHPNMDADDVLTQFYERNIAWQSDCEKRSKMLYEESVACQVGHRPADNGSRPASMHSNVRHGVQKRSSSTGKLERSRLVRDRRHDDTNTSNSVAGMLETEVRASPLSTSKTPADSEAYAIKTSSADSASCFVESCGKHASANKEHEEVMNHLQELRDCLLSSKCRLKSAAGGRRPVRDSRSFCNCPRCNVASLWTVRNPKVRSHTLD